MGRKWMSPFYIFIFKMWTTQLALHMGSDKWDLACTIFPTGDMINTYGASWWMLFIICGKDNILVFIFFIKLMCGDKTLHLVCCLGSESQPISLSCWMNELRCSPMETSGCASSASLGLFLLKPQTHLSPTGSVPPSYCYKSYKYGCLLHLYIK